MLELASTGVPFKALAAIHPGLPAARREDLTDVTGPMLFCTGSEDTLCNPDQVFAFTGALQEAGSTGAYTFTTAPSTLSGRGRPIPMALPSAGRPTSRPPCPA